MGEGTKYLILQQHEKGVWTERGEVESTGSEAARRAWANEHLKRTTEAGSTTDPPESKVTLVAVPLRSFDPLTFAIETEVKLKVVADSEPEPTPEPEPAAGAKAKTTNETAA